MSHLALTLPRGRNWLIKFKCGCWVKIFLVLRCQCSQWQQQGQTTAKTLTSQSSSLHFSKAPIKLRAFSQPLLLPHRSTLHPTTSLLVVLMTHTGRKSAVCLCLFKSFYQYEFDANTAPDLIWSIVCHMEMDRNNLKITSNNLKSKSKKITSSQKVKKKEKAK